MESVAELNERMEDYTLVLECITCGIKKELSMRHFVNDYSHPFMPIGNFVCSQCLRSIPVEIIEKHTEAKI